MSLKINKYINKMDLFVCLEVRDYRYLKDSLSVAVCVVSLYGLKKEEVGFLSCVGCISGRR